MNSIEEFSNLLNQTSKLIERLHKVKTYGMLPELVTKEAELRIHESE